MKTRTITKWIGKGFMIALDSGMVLDFVSWLGKRKRRRAQAARDEIIKARDKARR